MSTRQPPHKLHPDLEEFEPLTTPMDLRCGECKESGQYQVGRIFIDPETSVAKDPEVVDEGFAFTRYFHCEHCGAGGPWQLTPESKSHLLPLLIDTMSGLRTARVQLGHLALFDDTPFRWATQGEAHLMGLIEQTPNDYYLWYQLGNLYKVGNAQNLALDAYYRALRFNADDVESLHFLAELHSERQENREAGDCLHQLLLRIRQAPPRTPRELLRPMLTQAIEILVDLNAETNGRIRLFPDQPLPGGPPIPTVGLLSKMDLSREDDRDEVVEWWLKGKFPGGPGWGGVRSAAARASLIGRNDPCPCGSGKKHKKCCMRE